MERVGCGAEGWDIHPKFSLKTWVESTILPFLDPTVARRVSTSWEMWASWDIMNPVLSPFTLMPAVSVFYADLQCFDFPEPWPHC